MRPDCAVLMNSALSGKSCENVMRLLPANTCAPTPIRNTELVDHASASLTSLIAPSTLFRSVRVTVSVGAPTFPVRLRFVSEDRSRKVDELSPSVHDWPMGSTPSISGKRAVVVLALPDAVVTRRNSGEYCKKSAEDPTPASEAGDTELRASKSAIPPPAPSARALNPPAGYPRPCRLRAPCAPLRDAKEIVASAAATKYGLRIKGAPKELF